MRHEMSLRGGIFNGAVNLFDIVEGGVQDGAQPGRDGTPG